MSLVGAWPVAKGHPACPVTQASRTTTGQLLQHSTQRDARMPCGCVREGLTWSLHLVRSKPVQVVMLQDGPASSAVRVYMQQNRNQPLSVAAATQVAITPSSAVTSTAG